MNWFIHALIIFSLSVQVVPAGLSYKAEKNKIKGALVAVVMVFVEVMMFGLGKLLGSSFLHLLANWKNGIVFAVFFITGVRMIMDAFKIRKGKVAYRLVEPKFVFLTAVAQSINTFIIGLMFYFFPHIDFKTSLIALSLLSFFMILPSIFTPQNRISLSFAAVLYVLGGGFFVLTAFYLGFAL